MSQRLSASMSNASCSVISFFAIAGALPPALEVEKNSGSISPKSPSACMRSINTEPTMPRQPTKPTNLLIFNAPIKLKKQCPTGTEVHLARLARRGARRTRLNQPLMVVVVLEEVIARAATDARAAGVVFKRNVWAANIARHCSGAVQKLCKQCSFAALQKTPKPGCWQQGSGFQR